MLKLKNPIVTIFKRNYQGETEKEKKIETCSEWFIEHIYRKMIRRSIQKI